MEPIADGPTVLVPVDFSDCSHGLVESSALLARRLGGRVVLLHVVDAPQGTASGDDRLDAEALTLLEPHIDHARSLGVDAVGLVDRGPVPERILQAARRERADFIGMGTHGRRGVARLVVGSVAEQVLRSAEVPVITWRTRHRPECPASSCSVCVSHITPEQLQALSETQG